MSVIFCKIKKELNYKFSQMNTSAGIYKNIGKMKEVHNWILKN